MMHTYFVQWNRLWLCLLAQIARWPILNLVTHFCEHTTHSSWFQFVWLWTNEKKLHVPKMYQNNLLKIRKKTHYTICCTSIKQHFQFTSEIHAEGQTRRNLRYVQMSSHYVIFTAFCFFFLLQLMVLISMAIWLFLNPSKHHRKIETFFRKFLFKLFHCYCYCCYGGKYTLYSY